MRETDCFSSAQRQDQRLRTQTETQEVPSECQKTHFCCEGCWAPAWALQRVCGVFILGYSKSSGHNHGQFAIGDSVWIGVLNKMTSNLNHSVILQFCEYETLGRLSWAEIVNIQLSSKSPSCRVCGTKSLSFHMEHRNFPLQAVTWVVLTTKIISWLGFTIILPGIFSIVPLPVCTIPEALHREQSYPIVNPWYSWSACAQRISSVSRSVLQLSQRNSSV